MKIIIIIPARGGSKRIPRKNMVMLKNKPLVSYTLDALKFLGLEKSTFVSTDDQNIKSLSSKEGFNVIDRPKLLCGDKISTESVIMHVLETYLNLKKPMPDWVMTIPPTSPLRKLETIKLFIKLSETLDNDIDCAMTISESRGDYWLKKKKNDHIITRLFKDAPRNQLEREPLYEETSSIYLTRTKTLLDKKSILGHKVFGVNTKFPENLDINNFDDLLLAETILNNENIYN